MRSVKTIALFAIALIETFGVCFQYPSSDNSDLGWDWILYSAFRNDGLLLLAACAVCCLVGKRTLRLIGGGPFPHYRCVVIVSALFALFVIVGRGFTVEDVGIGSYGSFDTMFATPFLTLATVVSFAGLWMLFFSAMVLAVAWFARSAEPTESRAIETVSEPVVMRITAACKVFLSTASAWKIAIVLLIAWMPYYVVYFPGCLYHDSADQLRQFFGADPLSAHHPLLTTYIFGGLVSLGEMLGSDGLGVLFCMVLQSVVLSYACARVTCCARCFAGSGWRFSLVVVLFFAFVPLWGSAATSIKKDALFYSVFALLVVQVFELLNRRHCGLEGKVSVRHCVVIAALALLTSLIRNDGYLFVVCLLACTALFAFVRRVPHAATNVARLGAVFVVVSLAYLVGYKGIVMNALNAEGGSPVEALTVPIQQIARYYIEAPEDVTPEMEEGVASVLDTEGLRGDVYNPLVSDNIKFGYSQDDIDLSDLVAFGKAYLQMGLEHPVVFLEAFIDQTSGWWYPEHLGKPDWTVGEMGLYQNVPKVDRYSDVLTFDMPVYGTPFGQGFKHLIAAFGYLPGLGLLVYPAIYLWLLLFLVAFLCTTARGRDCLMLLPFFLYFLICMASPVNGLTRYAMAVIICLPLLVAWIIGVSRNDNIAPQGNACVQCR